MTHFHSDQEIACCKIAFNSYLEFDLHKAKKHHQKVDDGLICPKCQKAFASLDRLMTHVRVDHHNHLPFKCEECNIYYDTITRLNSHKKNVHVQEKNYHCEKCGKSFKTASSLTIHQQSMHSEKELHCDKCEYTTNRQKCLDDHYTRHHTSGNFICDVCGRTYTNPLSLKTHKSDVHDDKNFGEFKCTYEGCDAVFSKLRTMKSHVLKKHVRPGHKPHKCQYCPARFDAPGKKIDHEKNVHLNINDVECDICGFKTSSKKRLNKHTRNVHSTDEFFCDYPGCSKSYGIKGNLTAHRARVHKIPRPGFPKRN